MSTTPRLVLDADRLAANIGAMAERVRATGARLRPHVKTHKSPEIMRRQIAAGAVGVTVATLREAEVMVEGGAGDVLIAYPPVGADRLRRLGALAERARVTVACSEPGHVRALASLDAGLGYYWEVECGTGRLGSAPGEATAELVEAVAELPGVELRGIMAFPGHAYAAHSPEALAQVAADEAGALAATAAALRERGLEPGVLSAGATPLAGTPAGTATEYRFGNYVFNDATQVALGSAALDQCALTVEATVVGRPAADRVILDAGSKALAAERMSAATATFGLVRDHPELRVAALYEEHAICHADAPVSLSLGDRVHVIPNHACTCANLHADYTVVAGDEVVDRWPVAARGWAA